MHTLRRIWSQPGPMSGTAPHVTRAFLRQDPRAPPAKTVWLTALAVGGADDSLQCSILPSLEVVAQTCHDLGRVCILQQPQLNVIMQQ
jgi:hypothetical protein